MWWKVSRIFDRLEQMTDQAAEGTFLESDYNETRLSRLESKWAAYLGRRQVCAFQFYRKYK